MSPIFGRGGVNADMPCQSTTFLLENFQAMPHAVPVRSNYLPASLHNSIKLG